MKTSLIRKLVMIPVTVILAYLAITITWAGMSDFSNFSGVPYTLVSRSDGLHYNRIGILASFWYGLWSLTVISFIHIFRKNLIRSDFPRSGSLVWDAFICGYLVGMMSSMIWNACSNTLDGSRFFICLSITLVLAVTFALKLELSGKDIADHSSAEGPIWG